LSSPTKRVSMVVTLVTLLAALAAACSSSALASHSDVRRPASSPPSSDPFVASLAYARCMRRYGVPQPDPDKNGDFHLTAAQERRLLRVSPATRKSAQEACFPLLKGLNLKPLSRQALARANRVIAELGQCMRDRGHKVGVPNAKNLGHGTASFGFSHVERPKGYWASTAGKRYVKDLDTCMEQIHFAAKLTRIIKADRTTGKDL
jgi:hypothetical protein